VGSVRLRVIGKDSGSVLEGIEVFRGSIFESRLTLHADGDRPVSARKVGGSRSPVKLNAPWRRRVWGPPTYWVRAPGHAWASVAIDHPSGGERQLALERGAALEVVLEKLPSVSDLKILLRRAPDPEEERALRDEIQRILGIARDPARRPTYWQLYLAKIQQSRGRIACGRLWRFLNGILRTEFEIRMGSRGRATIDYLPPGRWCIHVGSRSFHDIREEPPLGEAEVALEPGKRERVAIVLEMPRSAKMAPLSGTFRRAPGWKEKEIRVSATGMGRAISPIPLARMAPSGQDPMLYSWSAGPMPAGRYTLAIWPTDQKVEVDLPEQGMNDVRLEMLERAELVVQVCDLATGGEAPVKRILWGLESSDGNSWSYRRVTRRFGRKEFSVSVPAGRIHLDIDSREYRCVDRTALYVRAVPGRNDVTLHVERDQGLTIVLKDQKAVVPFSMDAAIEVRAVQGSGRILKVEGRKVGLLYSTSEPGPYRVTVGPLAGFRPVEPLEVEVKRGEFTRVVVRFERLG
jgi:hypothetical protein